MVFLHLIITMFRGKNAVDLLLDAEVLKKMMATSDDFGLKRGVL